MTTVDTFEAEGLKDRADRLFLRKRLTAFGLPLLVLCYLAYTFFAFDIPGVADRARLDNAKTLLADTWSHKTHVTRDNRSGEVSVAIEGERKGLYPADAPPEWVEKGDTTRIELGQGHVVEFLPDNGLRYDVPGFGLIEASVSRAGGVETNLDEDALPDWISHSKARLNITTEAGRVSITRNRTEVFRYFAGWELFFFTLDSPYHGVPFTRFFGERIDPERGNLTGALHDFWHNDLWHHRDVAWAICETILMAFLGTFGAAIIALPVAFLAAKNFAPLQTLRFLFRRVFDFLRGVDALIWTILLSRAFGPGPMTGALAILLTDTGSFGKMFSEALENTDPKQIEGIRSTGAAPVQRYRFGVIPQVMPVLLSQVLYFLESNTRSATIIGAITGGGIGLLLTQAMITQKDWEEVSYYILLVIAMVFVMDWLSGWLRRRLIRGG